MKKTVSLFALIFVLGSLLFLFSCTTECSHEFLSAKVITPTCDTEGYTLNTCTECQAEFKTNYVLPLGHQITETVFAPTCTDKGYTYYSCRCGYNYTAQIIPPSGHNYTQEVRQVTCDRSGYTEYTCSVCAHSYCGDVISASGHNTSYTIYPPTATQMGYTEYSCSVCEFSYRDDFEFFSEAFGGDPITDDTVLYKGIDVSKHQHASNASGEYLPLDWEAIKASGIDFAILRTGYMGTGNIGVIDPTYEMDYAGAKAAGIAVGAYFYSYASDEAELDLELEQLLIWLDGKQFEYPIYFDIEDDSVANEEQKEILTALCIKFVDVMRENGYYGAVYTNQKWLTDYLYGASLRRYCDVWYARYPHLDKVTPEVEFIWNYELYGDLYSMWQYTSAGVLDGCGLKKNQTVDLNYCYKDYPTIIKKYGLNGFENEHLAKDQ